MLGYMPSAAVLVEGVAAVVRQYPGVELVEVEGDGVQEGFGKDVAVAAPEEAAEAVILL